MSILSNMYSSIFGDSQFQNQSDQSVNILDESEDVNIVGSLPKTKFCTCPTCNEQLLKKNNGKLQIWYGSGNNGKSTLLNRLAERVVAYDGKSVRYISPTDLEYPLYDTGVLEDNIGLFIITETTAHELDDLIRNFHNHGNRWVKHIICTNLIPEGIEESALSCIYADRVDLIHFEHKF